MSAAIENLKGVANDAIGTIKKEFGVLVGSDRLEMEGAAQQLKGDAQRAESDVRGQILRSCYKDRGVRRSSLSMNDPRVNTNEKSWF
jgi:uncharacterized protein YjbJ (UPF0337 family)